MVNSILSDKLEAPILILFVDPDRPFGERNSKIILFGILQFKEDPNFLLIEIPDSFDNSSIEASLRR